MVDRADQGMNLAEHRAGGSDMTVFVFALVVTVFGLLYLRRRRRRLTKPSSVV
jgi:hypothetical protein